MNENKLREIGANRNSNKRGFNLLVLADMICAKQEISHYPIKVFLFPWVMLQSFDVTQWLIELRKDFHQILNIYLMGSWAALL